MSHTYSAKSFRLPGGIEVMLLTEDPTVAPGVVAEVGTIGLRDNAGMGETWLKLTTGDTAWIKIVSDDDYRLLIPSLTGEPSGFYERDETTLSVDDLSRTFTITPVGTAFSIYSKGKRFDFSDPQEIQFENIEGLHYFYFDESGVLKNSVVGLANLKKGEVPAAQLYWDATNEKTTRLGDERHGIGMPDVIHSYLHEVFGAQYVSGLAPFNLDADGGGGDDTNAQMAVTGGTVVDEDLRFVFSNGLPQTLAPIAQIPVFYQLGTTGTWRKKPADNFPMVYYQHPATYLETRPAYNLNTDGTWSLAAVPNNQFFLMHFFASNELVEPIFAVVGQAVFTNISAARTAAKTQISNIALFGLPGHEMVPLYTLIFQTADSYSNTPKAQLRTTDLGDDYVDFRGQRLVPGGGADLVAHDLGGLLHNPSTLTELSNLVSDATLAAIDVSQDWTKGQRDVPLAIDLTEETTTFDAKARNQFYGQLSIATTELQSPSNLAAGQWFSLDIQQATAGGKALTFVAAYDWGADGAPDFTTLPADEIATITCHVLSDGVTISARCTIPVKHAATHVNGSDDIQNATASQKGLATAAQITKLDGIEAGADVTDSAGIAAAGGALLAATQAWTKGQYPAESVLSIVTGHVTVSPGERNHFYLDITGDAQVDNPGTLVAGMSWRMIIESNGSNELTWGTYYAWGGTSGAPDFSALADGHFFVCDFIAKSATKIACSFSEAYS